MKDPQRLRHKVRFNIEFDYKEEDSHKSKPLIVFVQAGSISENKFFNGDLIKSINNIQIKTGDDLDNEINKLNWGDEVLFEVERKNKIEKVNIKTISFNHYKENCVAGEKLNIPCTKEYNPVCGCNEITYSNKCVAKSFGVKDWTLGKC